MGVYRFLFSVAVETFQGRNPTLYCRRPKDRGVPAEEREHASRTGTSRRECAVGALRQKPSRRWSVIGTLRPNGHGVCLFRSGCHNTPTTDRSGVLTSIIYSPRNPRFVTKRVAACERNLVDGVLLERLLHCEWKLCVHTEDLYLIIAFYNTFFINGILIMYF